MNNFYVIVHVEGVVDSNKRFTLDQLLSSIKYKKSFNLSDAFENLPLDKTMSIWHASQGFIKIDGNCSHVIWYGRGDVGAVKEILSDLDYLTGYGEQGLYNVLSIDLGVMDTDLSLINNKQPSRPIPLEIWDKLSNELAAHTDLQHSTVCAVPENILI